MKIVSYCIYIVVIFVVNIPMFNRSHLCK